MKTFNKDKLSVKIMPTRAEMGEVAAKDIHDEMLSLLNKKAEITYEMLKIVPMGENPPALSDEEEAAPTAPQNSINPQVWYEQKGRVVLENIITDLNSRGHSSLSITESGDVIIKQDEREIKKATLEAMPDKVYWHRLAKVFQGEGLAASVTDSAVVVSW